MGRPSTAHTDLGYTTRERSRAPRAGSQAAGRGQGPVLHHVSPGDRSAAETHLKELRRLTGSNTGTQTGSRPSAGREASAAAIEAAQRAAIASVRAEFWAVWCGVHPTKSSLADVGREFREGRA